MTRTLRPYRALRLLLPAAALAAAIPLVAAKPDGVAVRIQGYKALGAAYKTVSDGLRRGSPDIAAMRAAARTISKAARDQYGWYPPTSAPGKGAKTAAKAEIWRNRAGFRAQQDKFASLAQAFEKAAASGDVAAMRSASRTLGATCKGCHDQFRIEQD